MTSYIGLLRGRDMNKKQIAYQVGRFLSNFYDIIFFTGAGFCAYASAHFFLKVQDIRDLNSIRDIAYGIMSGIAAVHFGYWSLLGLSGRYGLYSEAEGIITNKENYPFEYVNSVIFEDYEGLELLLEKTREGEREEWGTFLKAYEDEGKAYIYEILDVKEAKRSGLFTKGVSDRVYLEIHQAAEEGYQGVHHYHPPDRPIWLGAMNFAVGINDRFKMPNWINLITFNLTEGPEIIAYNRQHTYILKDKLKRELVLATPKQIMEYLKS